MRLAVFYQVFSDGVRRLFGQADDRRTKLRHAGSINAHDRRWQAPKSVRHEPEWPQHKPL
jgi:hypothetical protein